MIVNRVLDFMRGRSGHWHIVGDSHISGVRWAYKHKLLERPCLFTEVGGATAVGLRNPNSATNAIGMFRKALFPKRRNRVPVIQLGEVDCGFVIWYRAKKYGESVDKQFEQSISAYMEFVDDLLENGYKWVVLTGAILPTILDGQDWGEVANLRREVTATLRERTDLTLEYNARLKGAAESRSLPFVDLSETLLDQEMMMIAPYFRNSNSHDHHLDPRKIGPLWAKELNGIGDKIFDSAIRYL